jgi:histidine ammonia-lyase
MGQNIIKLSGYDLTYEQIKKISMHGEKVEISKEGLERLKAAREIVITLEKKEQSVYGLNTGVGWNKDRKVNGEFYDKYNKSLLRSHMIGIDPECTIQEIRAIILIRLNGFLCGHTGVSIEVAQYYEAFFNKGIHPIIKKRASVSVADIGTLSAIGLALIGEGEVFYKGKRVYAKEALEKEVLEPLKLGSKDGLSIVSSNAQSAAFAAIALLELEHFLELYQQVFCLSLEGYNGVVDPLEEKVNHIRGYKGQITCSRICREHLEGSYLFEPYEDRSLQDPLSYRCHCSVTGAVMDAIEYFRNQLEIEINSTDDNPCILPEEGRCFGSSNFIPLSWVFGLEMVAIALNHLSKMMCNRMMRLSDPNFTKLPRFLSPNEAQVIGFGTIQKTFASLDSENRMFANPSSMDFLSLAGQIEDHSSNATMEAAKVRRIIDNLYYMMGIELMHAAQAVDLRKLCKLGKKTSELYNDYRQVISFLDEDRNLSIDIEQSYQFLKNYEPKKA